VQTNADSLEPPQTTQTRATRNSKRPAVIQPTMETRQEGGKTYADVADLELWDDNPREVNDADLERLRKHLEAHGQFKPLIVTGDGTVIGGNQRLKTMREMGREEAYVSVVDPEDEDEMMEIAMADNDRAGSYDEERVAELMDKYDIDVSRFKVDFYAPQDLAQNLATKMDPEELLESGGDADSENADADAEDTDADADSGSADAADSEDDTTPRSMEHLGETTATAMVQLFMTEDAKQTFQERVTTLKREYDLDTTSDAVEEAVRRESERAEMDEGEAELLEAGD